MRCWRQTVSLFLVNSVLYTSLVLQRTHPSRKECPNLYLHIILDAYFLIKSLTDFLGKQTAEGRRIETIVSLLNCANLDSDCISLLHGLNWVSRLLSAVYTSLKNFKMLRLCTFILGITISHIALPKTV